MKEIRRIYHRTCDFELLESTPEGVDDVEQQDADPCLSPISPNTLRFDALLSW
jgi:hypothetical protein